MKTKRFRGGQIAAHVILAVLVLLVLLPVCIMLVKSFKTPTQERYDPYTLTFPLHLENYSLAFQTIVNYLLNTLLIAFGCTAGILILSATMAYGYSRYRFRGRKAIYMAIIALMMVPGILTLIPQYLLVIELGLMRNRWGVILPSVAGSLPINFMLLCTFYRAIPDGLYDAMSIDGANKFAQFVRLTIPLSVPILATIALNSWIGAWNDLVWPTIVLTEDRIQTLSVALNAFTAARYAETRTYSVAMAGYVIASLPLILLFAFTSRQFIRGLTSGAFKM